MTALVTGKTLTVRTKGTSCNGSYDKPYMVRLNK